MSYIYSRFISFVCTQIIQFYFNSYIINDRKIRSQFMFEIKYAKNAYKLNKVMLFYQENARDIYYVYSIYHYNNRRVASPHLNR